MSELLKISGFDQLVKDPKNGGVINIDRGAYKSHLVSKQLAQRDLAEKKASKESIQSMQTEINTIKNDISEIKNMILNLIEKGR